MAQMQVTEGIYDCVWTGGGRSGPRGVDKVDGISYYGNFGYFFGITPGLCVTELKGRRVRLYYLAPKNIDRKLTLELVDMETNGIWRISKEKNIICINLTHP